MIQDPRDALANWIEAAEKALEAADRLFDFVVASHPNGKELKRQIDSGELERRLKVLGGDPLERVSTLLEYRALRKKTK